MGWEKFYRTISEMNQTIPPWKRFYSNPLLLVVMKDVEHPILKSGLNCSTAIQTVKLKVLQIYQEEGVFTLMKIHFLRLISTFKSMENDQKAGRNNLGLAMIIIIIVSSIERLKWCKKCGGKQHMLRCATRTVQLNNWAVAQDLLIHTQQ